MKDANSIINPMTTINNSNDGNKLQAVASWLSVRCEATEGDNVWHHCCTTDDDTNIESVITVPSFSLDHEHLESNNNDNNNNEMSKEEVQCEASKLLSKPTSVKVRQSSATEDVLPRIILSNLYSSFDKLVDARISAFSKILSGHLSSHKEEEGEEASSAHHQSAMVLEYKLKTLLEIGTSIFADSVTTSFTPITTTTTETSTTSEDGTTTIIIPMTMKVEIDNFHLPCSASGDTAIVPVIFEAPGTIKGESPLSKAN